MSFSAQNLTCLRGDQLVFEDISFDVAAGQALWIRGKNGAGKSSLLRICAGLLKPVGGHLRWGGVEISDNPDMYQGKYHYQGHQDALKAVLTVRENLTFWAKYNGRSNVGKAISDFALADLAETQTGLLSAGQKKRVALARLLTSPAPLWILDEPVSSLDAAFIELFKKHLVAHLDAGGMALLATHQDLELPEVATLNLDTVGAT